MADDVAERIASKMKEYAQQWKKNAAAFAAAGDYEWMASFVRDYRKVLEIGTGVGTATRTLLRDAHQVLSLDLNPWCLEAAENALRAEALNVAQPRRSQEIVVGPNGFDVRYGPMPPVALNADAVLLLTDVLTDEALPPVLKTVAPFDALCWWCPGTYGYRAGLEDEDKKRYRYQMRIALCHVAQQLLRSGGVFHVVDRSVASMPKDEHRQSLIAAYTAAAEGTSLRVTAVDFRPIETLSAPGGISMPHAHLPGGETGKFTLLSVLLQKA